MVQFTINRARQYGKTTTLNALKRRFENEYMIFLISFEGIEEEVFADVGSFCVRLFGLLYDTIDFGEVEGVPEEIREELHRRSMGDPKDVNFRMLTNLLTRLCREAGKPVVLMIDEVDQAGDYQVFVTFLGCLRDMYLKRNTRPTFQSVILAGVYDIKNLKIKIRPDEEHKYNSPWNIAARFNVNMSFSAKEIALMLQEYEEDKQTGMDVNRVAKCIYDYTSGYPYLVSVICKFLDEEIPGNKGFSDVTDAWTEAGVGEAVKIFLSENTPLFDSMVKQLDTFKDLRNMVEEILYQGKLVPYSPHMESVNLGLMFGFLKGENGHIVIANRIFEMGLLNMFITEESANSEAFQ